MESLLDLHGIHKQASEVDFIIPFLEMDRRYFIDPSLIRFSDNTRIQEWMRTVDIYRQLINDYIKADDTEGLRRVLDTGEARVIGLGYARTSVNGSGVGREIADSIIKVLTRSAGFKEKGLERFEQLQFLDKGIADDRISDLLAHVLKEQLIEYTIEQAAELNIPTERCRIGRVFDYVEHKWVEKTAMVPVNPKVTVRDALCPYMPILLVPKEIVRPLPIFLNYNTYVGFLDKNHIVDNAKNKAKALIIKSTRENPEISLRYISEREADRKEKLTRRDFDSNVLELADIIEAMPTGQQHRDEFRDKCGEALTNLFSEDLHLVGSETSTALRASRRDLMFRITASTGILADLKSQYGAQLITVDTKNVNRLSSDDIKQVSSYLNDRSGRAGIIIIPNEPTDANINSVRDIYLHDGKIILLISKMKLVNSLRGQSRVRAYDGVRVPKYDPYGFLEYAHNIVLTA